VHPKKKRAKNKRKREICSTWFNGLNENRVKEFQVFLTPSSFPQNRGIRKLVRDKIYGGLGPNFATLFFWSYLQISKVIWSTFRN
jgi:hypothetical protein